MISQKLKILLEINNLLKKWVHPSITKIAIWIWTPKSLATTLKITNELYQEWYITKDNNNKIIWITKRWEYYIWEEKLVLKNKVKLFDIPILWNISCWNMLEAFEEIKWYISISEDILKWNPSEYFILEANGDSMNNYITPINNGDLLLMKKQNYASNWDVVIALYDYEKATLKEYKRNNLWYIQLIPHSTSEIHKPIIINDNLIIQWIFVRNIGQFNF